MTWYQIRNTLFFIILCRDVSKQFIIGNIGADFIEDTSETQVTPLKNNSPICHEIILGGGIQFMREYQGGGGGGGGIGGRKEKCLKLKK